MRLLVLYIAFGLLGLASPALAEEATSGVLPAKVLLFSPAEKKQRPRVLVFGKMPDEVSKAPISLRQDAAGQSRSTPMDTDGKAPKGEKKRKKTQKAP